MYGSTSLVSCSKFLASDSAFFALIQLVQHSIPLPQLGFLPDACDGVCSLSTYVATTPPDATATSTTLASYAITNVLDDLHAQICLPLKVLLLPSYLILGIHNT